MCFKSVHPKRRGRDYWLAVDRGSHQPPSQRPLRSRRKTTTRRPGAQGPPQPRQPVSWSTTCLLVNHPTTSGNATWADPETDGSTRSGRTMESPRRTCGGERQVVVTEEQRYGTRWLRDNDDNDKSMLKCKWQW